MTPRESARGDSTPLPVRQRVDAVCRRFEDAWLAGARPRVEDYLGGLPAEERPVLLRELLGIDVAYRRQQRHAHQSQARQARHIVGQAEGGLLQPAENWPAHARANPSDFARLLAGFPQERVIVPQAVVHGERAPISQEWRSHQNQPKPPTFGWR